MPLSKGLVGWEEETEHPVLHFIQSLLAFSYSLYLLQ